MDRLRRGELALDPLLRLAFANEFRLRGAKVADKHYTQRAEQGQRRKGAVEEEIGKAEEHEFDDKKRRRERHSDTDRAQRPRVAQQPDDHEPGRERRSELEPIEKWWAVEQVAEQDQFDQLGMEVDRADETEGRLPQPGDADAGNPEQYYLPPQLGWVERRIEDVRGRDGPRL